MVTLYHCTNARSLRVLWALEELALPYELKMLPFPPRVHARDYLKINPLGTVPLLLDGATRMTESAAICQYLAQRYKPHLLDIGPAHEEFGQFLNWIHFGEVTLTVPQTIVLRYSRLESPERRHVDVAVDYTRWFHGRLRAVDQAILERQWLCAGRFTLADISVGYALFLTQFVGLHAQMSHAVRAYSARLQEREGFRRALEAQRRAAQEQQVEEFNAGDSRIDSP